MGRKVDPLLVDTTGLVPVVIWDKDGSAALFEYFEPESAELVKRNFDLIREDPDGTIHLKEKNGTGSNQKEEGSDTQKTH